MLILTVFISFICYNICIVLWHRPQTHILQGKTNTSFIFQGMVFVYSERLPVPNHSCQTFTIYTPTSYLQFWMRAVLIVVWMQHSSIWENFPRASLFARKWKQTLYVYWAGFMKLSVNWHMAIKCIVAGV